MHDKIWHERVYHGPAIKCQIWPRSGMGWVQWPLNDKNLVKFAVFGGFFFFSFPSLFLFSSHTSHFLSFLTLPFSILLFPFLFFPSFFSLPLPLFLFLSFSSSFLRCPLRSLLPLFVFSLLFSLSIFDRAVGEGVNAWCRFCGAAWIF